MVKIKMLEDSELSKKGEIVNYSKKSAEYYIKLGVAVLAEDKKNEGYKGLCDRKTKELREERKKIQSNSKGKINTGRKVITSEDTNKPKIERIITIDGSIHIKSREGPRGGLVDVAVPVKKDITVKLTGSDAEFYYNNKLINSFKLRGKPTNSQISQLARVLLDIGAFDKNIDARHWITNENIFDLIHSWMGELINLNKDYKKKIKLREIALTKLKTNDQKISETVLIKIASKQNDDATELMVEYIKQNEHLYTTRDDEHSEMWIYHEGIYIPQGRTYIHERVRLILKQAFTTYICNQVITKIAADTYINQDVFFCNDNGNLIPVLNGIFDVTTKELKPFTPDLIFFNKLQVIYDPNANCPKIIQFFDSVLMHEKDKKVIQEVFGFLVEPTYKYEKAIMLHGSGRNGKGKTITLMKNFLGADNCSEIPLEDIEKDIFAVGELHNKKANLCGDLSKTAIKNSGRFKNLTGRDMITAARKFKTRVKFINVAKMIFSANELPITEDLTDAFFLRWIIIKFPYQFLPQKEIDKLPIDKRQNIKLQDPDIMDKLTSEDEMSGLLNWALEGYDRLKENNSFSVSYSAEEIKAKWLKASNSIAAFILDNIDRDPNSYLVKNIFKNTYVDYCSVQKLPILDDKQIKHGLMTLMGASDERKTVTDETTGDRTQYHTWTGICFKGG